MLLFLRTLGEFSPSDQFVAYTDHKPLTLAMKKLTDDWMARQQRQLYFISEFTTDIRHIAGRFNAVADTLFRISTTTLMQTSTTST